MPKLLVVADARWVLHLIVNAVAWAVIGLAVVYLVAGFWWTLAVIAAAAGLALVVAVLWRVFLG